MIEIIQHALKGQKLLAQGNALGIMSVCNAPCKGKSFKIHYCCPLKLRPSRARVCMHMQASKNKKLGWLLFEESALFGNFAATKQTSLPKHGQRYTFSRTADTKSATKLLQQAKNSLNQPRIGWREVCKDV